MNRVAEFTAAFFAAVCLCFVGCADKPTGTIEMPAQLTDAQKSGVDTATKSAYEADMANRGRNEEVEEEEGEGEAE